MSLFLCANKTKTSGRQCYRTLEVGTEV